MISSSAKGLMKPNAEVYLHIMSSNPVLKITAMKFSNYETNGFITNPLLKDTNSVSLFNVFIRQVVHGQQVYY